MNSSMRLAIAFLLMLGLAACVSNRAQESQADSPAVINAKLGLGYLRQGNYDVALSKLKKSLQEDPKLAMAHHYIAEVYQQTGAYDLAGEHFERAIKLDPHDPLLQNNYGVFLCDQKRYKEAEQRFLKVATIQSYKQPDEAYENAGLCALRIPDPVKAEKYFRKALQINPKLPNSLYQMAQLSFDTQQYLEARAFLQRFFSVSDSTPQSLWLGIRIERQQGDAEAADRYKKILLGKYPDSDEARSASSIK